jgi:dTDP-4-dehydrorhamnose reductase
MRILLTGSEGMLARDFLDVLDQFPEFDCFAPPRSKFDITNPNQVESNIQEFHPEVLLNCAAYTKVDQAETESDIAFSVNGSSVGTLAKACHRYGIKLVHLSTDFVFDGRQRCPHTESDSTAPLGVYGKSKRNGEEQIEESKVEWLTVRTSWLFASHGHNFVRTMLRLGEERKDIRVISDQIGSPTWTRDLALAICRLIKVNGKNYVHFGGANSCSWFELAKYTIHKAYLMGILSTQPEVIPIRTDQYSLPAPRPTYSVFSTARYQQLTGFQPIRWEDAVDSVLKRIQQNPLNE